MKRFLYLFPFICTAVASVAFADLTADRGTGTNKVVTSEVKTELAWRRDVVTVDELGQIHGDGGKVAQKAETAAIDDVAVEAVQIAEAAHASMTNSFAYLTSKTNQMANAGLGIALAFPPEQSDPNIRGYVVLTEYNQLTQEDIQWVHYNRELSLAPNRSVVYETYEQKALVKCIWDEWDAAGTNLTVSGRLWQGCHRCRVPRPAWCRGKACLEIPNEVWGGENGMDWGDMVLTFDNGRNYFTGFVTNTVSHQVAYFDNGFLKSIETYND